MSDETFSRRWLLLSVIGMLTSFLLTMGVAAFGFRGVASADQRAAKPTVSAEVRASSGTFLIREIGGNPGRTPTATVGTAPTIRQTDEPLQLAQRFIVNPEPTLVEQRPSEPTPEPEPEFSPPPVSAPVRQASQTEPAARMTSPASAVTNPAPTKAPVPPSQIIEAAATSTPVPRMANVSIPSPAASATAEPPRATSTAQPTATVLSTSTARAMAVKDQIPTVSIQLSDSKVEVGDTITVVVYGNDDEGLDWISWEGEDSGERALDRENRFDCNGRTSCAQSWTVRVSRTGSHTIQARAKDNDGLKSQPAYAELRVKTAATVTPTRTPAATATVKR
jgi:hypothetical protein